MGDIEAPAAGAAEARPNVLLSILPSKEFALSRKGMLLIAEVVRHYLGWDFLFFEGRCRVVGRLRHCL